MHISVMPLRETVCVKNVFDVVLELGGYYMKCGGLKHIILAGTAAKQA